MSFSFFSCRLPALERTGVASRAFTHETYRSSLTFATLRWNVLLTEDGRSHNVARKAAYGSPSSPILWPWEITAFKPHWLLLHNMLKVPVADVSTHGCCVVAHLKRQDSQSFHFHLSRGTFPPHWERRWLESCCRIPKTDWKRQPRTCLSLYYICPKTARTLFHSVEKLRHFYLSLHFEWSV